MLESYLDMGRVTRARPGYIERRSRFYTPDLGICPKAFNRATNRASFSFFQASQESTWAMPLPIHPAPTATIRLSVIYQAPYFQRKLVLARVLSRIKD